MIIDYLGQTRDGFVRVAQAPDARNLPYEMDVSAQSFASAQTRSVVLTLFQSVGGAHPTTWYKSFTFDVSQNRPVTFDMLFAPDTKPLQEIFPLVQRQLEKDTILAGSISPGDGLDPPLSELRRHRRRRDLLLRPRRTVALPCRGDIGDPAAQRDPPLQL